MDFLTIYREGYLCLIDAEERKGRGDEDWWDKAFLNEPWVGVEQDIVYAIEFQDGRKERCHVRRGTMQQPRSIPVGKCLEQGFTAPQNEIVKFLTGRITQLVMFRKYNKKKRTTPKNTNAGK